MEQYRRKREREIPHYSDVIYDYQVATLFIGMSHSQTLQWLVDGYPELEWDTVKAWKLNQYKEDPWKDYINA